MTTNHLATRLESVLAKTKPGQYAMTIERHLLVQIVAHLKLMELLSATSAQPATEQDKQPDDRPV